MAVLVSPGVSISVIDQSINVGAGPGTVPLIFIATQQDKTIPDGTSVAPGTTKANAGVVWSITSQRDLVQTFGDPTFYSVSGTSLNGYPLNEYGLLAAYSFLGISNLCRIVRADVNTTQLEATPVTPTSPAAAGTYWFDESTAGSAYGLFVRSGTFPNEVWTAVPSPTLKYNFATGTANSPVVTDGSIGDYAVVFQTANGTLSYWRKTKTAEWTQLGGPLTYTSAAGATSVTTVVTVVSTVGLLAGMIPTVSTGLGSFASNTRIVSVDSTTQFTVSLAPSVALSGGATVVKAGFTTNIGGVWPDLAAAATSENYWIKTGSAAQGANLVLRKMSASTGSFLQVEAPILTNDAAADTYYSTNAAGSVGQVYIEPIVTGTLPLSATNSLQFRLNTAGTWALLGTVNGSTTVPTQGPANGQLWFNALVGLDDLGQSTVDILTADGLGGWQNIDLHGFTTPYVHPVGAPVLFTQPADPNDNVPAPILVAGDIWVNTDSTPYPVINRWSGSAWVLVNNEDQTTPMGVIFQDARSNPLYHAGTSTGLNNNGGTNPDLDPDAPNADLYPKGFMLWNTRYSTNNVKVWQSPYVYNGVTAAADNTNSSSLGRWSSTSGNNPGGVPYMGAAAQQITIVKAIQATITSNEDIRAEDIYFNLIAAPGFVEAIDEMLVLNDDRKDTAFVVGDTPFTLSSTGTSLQNWATNASLAFGNGPDGLVSASKYFSAWYPSGLSTNVDGTDVVVPPSHMALRTIAYNDQVAYPWFAPAGLQRGVVNNAAAVGYVNSSGQFVSTKLNEGQRDILYQNGINPIRVMPQGGIVVFGQKTRQNYSSATDRINVVRLENYLRYQLNNLAQPFLFEPNDNTTRKSVLDAFNRALSELITLRGLYDFLVVCDLSNNTPARIDRNELWIDVAIQPVKAIEFIYIPIRIKNTGASLTV
jgi:hypothetical protein